jgi:Ca2+-binding EF-hand superfamily protein
MAMNARADELLKRFDTNHDGKLDEDEAAAAHEALLKEQIAKQAAIAAAPGGELFRQKMLQLFDKNHDGRLDDDERAEMRKYFEEHGLGPDGEVRAELMKRFDQNADGKLDDTERAAMEKFLQERRANAATMREFLLRQFDRNGNGTIDGDELPEFEKTTRERLTSNPAQLARYDLNGDGKLDDTEWAAAREQILRLVNNPSPAAPALEKSAPAVEKTKLEAIADEVARRKAAREKSAQETTGPATATTPATKP